MKFIIDKGVPTPDTTAYPVRGLEVGDSFFVPIEYATVSNVRAAVSQFSKRNKDYAFTVRKQPGGCRVWRIGRESK